MTQAPGAEKTRNKIDPPVEINFFKPHSPFTRENRTLTLILVGIWAVAVFGFQFLLIALQKPTPEPAHHEYSHVWSSVEAGRATPQQSKAFTRSTLSVLGKNVALRADHRAALKEALSVTVLGMLDGNDQATFSASLATADKADATRLAIGAIGLADNGFDRIMRALLPSSLVPVTGSALRAEIKNEIPAIMDRYLIHNRSALTDFTFLGFPFHYWFTGQFLLIFFVVLCFVYAKMITKIMEKHGRIKKEESKA